MSKPSVNARCVANSYSAADQRIIEISRRDGKAGCLVSISERGEGLAIDVYRADPGVTVTGPESRADLLAALGAALGLITKHGLAVELARADATDFARLESARAAYAAEARR